MSLLLLFSGCEVAEYENGGNISRGRSSSSLGSQRYFAHEIAIDIDASTEQRAQQSIRAQFRPEEVRQNVLAPTGEKDLPLDRDANDNLIAYAPLDLDTSPFGHVFNLDLIPNSGLSYGASSGSRTMIWTVPDYDPVENPIRFTIGTSSGVLTGRTVTINEQWSFLNTEDDGLDPVALRPPEVTVQISGVNFDGGSSGFEGRLRYRFSSTIPGLHTVENQVIHGDGSVRDGSWSYYQRTMEFTEEFPEYDDSTTDPVEIQNSVQWDDESPATEAEWGVRVGDLRKEGTGSEIYAVWNPVDETLERLVDPATLPVEDTLEPTELSVTARAPVFTEQWTQTGSIYYQINGGTDVPRRPILKIIDERIDPQDPFTEENNSATVSAEVIFFDPDIMQSDINWQVDIKNSAGEVVWAKLATGTGWDIAAIWDGTIEGAPLPPEDNDPTTYSFSLSAFLCDDDGGVVIGGRSLEGVNPQVIGDENCAPDPKALAQVDVPIGFAVEITSVTFAGNENLQSTLESGPYPVFDLITQDFEDYGLLGPARPQWVKETGAMLPVVMMGGSTIYVAAEIDIGDDVDSDSIIVRANGKLNDTDISLGTSAPIPREDWSEPVILSFDLPPVIDRYGLEIEWEFFAGSKKASVSTPSSERKHRLYGTAGFPRIDDISSNASGGQYIWYNSDTFEEDTPTSTPSDRKPPSRSPLDLATYWAKGIPVSQEIQVVETIALNLYENGGYFYVPDSRMSKHDFTLPSNRVRYDYFISLKSDLMECRDASASVAAMSRMLGIKVRMRIFRPPFLANIDLGDAFVRGRYAVFTSYLKMIGESEGRSAEEGGDWIAPLDSVPFSFFGVGAGVAPRNLLGPGNVPTQTFHYPWKQWPFNYHMINEVDNLAIDAVARVDSVERGLNVNPDFVFNQMNGPREPVKEESFISLRQQWQALYGKILAEEVLDRFESGYGLKFNPVGKKQEAVTMSEYISSAFYLMKGSTVLREDVGFNSFYDLGDTSTTREGLELVR